jgi:hypothetical protein
MRHIYKLEENDASSMVMQFMRKQYIAHIHTSVDLSNINFAMFLNDNGITANYLELEHFIID